MFESKKILLENNDWLTFLLLGIFFTLGIVKLVSSRQFSNAWTIFLQQKSLSILFYSEKKLLFNRYQFLMFFVRIFIFSIFIFQLNKVYQYKEIYFNFSGFLLISYYLFLFSSAKFILNITLATLFKLQECFVKVTYERICYTINTSLWILPLVIFSIYTDTTFTKIIIHITTVFSLLLLAFSYGFVINSNKKTLLKNLFYFILYICALEITPLLLFMKLTILE